MIITTGNIYTQREQSLLISLPKKVRGLCFVFILLIVFINVSGNIATAQEVKVSVVDTLPKATVISTIPAKAVKVHSPRKATILALVLPGAGQIYNHKYWKVPIVYAGFATMIYFIQMNNKLYHDVEDAYHYVSVTMKTVYPPTPPNIFPYPAPPNDYAIRYSEPSLLQGRDAYRHNLELSYILTGVWYILTVVDATVDAHFFDYNINDDLTLRVDPWIPALGMRSPDGISGGLSLNLRF